MSLTAGAEPHTAPPDSRVDVPVPPRGSPLARIALSLCIVAAVAGFTALGIWQLERRTWKLALIERVEQRVHAPPAAAPGPDAWPGITAAANEYRRVQVTGRFLNGHDTDVQALTDLGAGFWMLTPFRTDQGFLVLVNRGFVPPALRGTQNGQMPPTESETTVTGLLRLTEPRGSLLRSNDSAADRWYSRDVDAIAAARGLSDVAPYFIDAEAGPAPDAWPRGGLTVIAFPNNHLIYAITWFGLAITVCAAAIFARREKAQA